MLEYNLRHSFQLIRSSINKTINNQTNFTCIITIVVITEYHLFKPYIYTLYSIKYSDKYIYRYIDKHP